MYRYDSTTQKTRVVFMVSQFGYTLFAMLPTIFMFHNQTVHALVLLATYVISIWNGAGFYIEVFSAQYLKQFEIALKKDEAEGDGAEDGEDFAAVDGAGLVESGGSSSSSSRSSRRNVTIKE